MKNGPSPLGSPFLNVLENGGTGASGVKTPSELVTRDGHAGHGRRLQAGDCRLEVGEGARGSALDEQLLARRGPRPQVARMRLLDVVTCQTPVQSLQADGVSQWGSPSSLQARGACCRASPSSLRSAASSLPKLAPRESPPAAGCAADRLGE